jgi:hypothetical protein
LDIHIVPQGRVTYVAAGGYTCLGFGNNNSFRLSGATRTGGTLTVSIQGDPSEDLTYRIEQFDGAYISGNNMLISTDVIHPDTTVSAGTSQTITVTTSPNKWVNVVAGYSSLSPIPKKVSVTASFSNENTMGVSPESFNCVFVYGVRTLEYDTPFELSYRYDRDSYLLNTESNATTFASATRPGGYNFGFWHERAYSSGELKYIKSNVDQYLSTTNLEYPSVGFAIGRTCIFPANGVPATQFNGDTHNRTNTVTPSSYP